MTRPKWDEYFMNITKEVSMRSNCLSAKIGAVVVKGERIVSTGYNGAPRKTKDCIERGECMRRKHKIPSGHRYELCRSVHAEQNAIINAGRAGISLLDTDLYIYGVRIHNGEKLINALPCFICKKMIINAGINNVYSIWEDGSIKKFEVEKWVDEWQKNDMINDMDFYDTKYENPISKNN